MSKNLDNIFVFSTTLKWYMEISKLTEQDKKCVI